MFTNLKFAPLVLSLVLVLFAENRLNAQYANDCCCGNFQITNPAPVNCHTYHPPGQVVYPAYVYTTIGQTGESYYLQQYPSNSLSVFVGGRDLARAKSDCYKECIDCHGRGNQSYCANCCSGSTPTCLTCQEAGVALIPRDVLATTSPCFKYCIYQEGQINQRFCSNSCAAQTYQYPSNVIYPVYTSGN